MHTAALTTILARRWFRGLVVAGLVAAASGGAHGADAPMRLTLDQAVTLLRQQNPEVLSGILRVRAAHGDVRTARLYPNPTLSTGASNFSLGRTNPPGLSAGQTVVSQVGLEEELVLWGKRSARIAAATDKEAAARAERADLDRRLSFEVRKRFIDALIASERLRLARENLEHYRETVRVSEARRKAGDISASDLDKITLEQRGFEHEVADAEGDRREAIGELLPLVGLDTGDVEPVGAFGVPDVPGDVDALIGDAMARRPDLQEAQRAAEAADASLRLAKAEAWPNVTVGLQYVHSQFQVSGDLANQIGTTFSLPLPVADRNQGEIERAEAEALIARHEVAKLRLEVPQEVRTALTDYRIAKERVQRFDQAFLGQAREARKAAETSYREGAISLLEFLEAQRAFIQTEREYLDALRDAHTAAYDVTRAAALEVQP